MKKILVVVDMQNDFIDGSLGTPEARAIVDKVCEKIRGERWDSIFQTMDTHNKNYLYSQEGSCLPIKHCIDGTEGWYLNSKIAGAGGGKHSIIFKNTFGCVELIKCIRKDMNYWGVMDKYIELTLVGVCTDICVISNTLLLKAHFPEMKIVVDASCCAGSTPEKHRMALEVMKSCQIDIVGEENDRSVLGQSLNKVAGKRAKTLGLPISPLLDENYGWVKGIDRLPDKSGNYEVSYEGRISRDDYSVFVGRWWNVGNVLHPEEVEWRPNSFREIDL